MERKEREKIYFVSGIDTDAGKSYATGYIASQWIKEGHRVVTQKFIQTGCGSPDEVSEDIILHRKIMGTGLLPVDRDHTTNPIRFSYPASPDLASRLDGVPVDMEAIGRSTETLAKMYDIVLIEGAGGLMVPVTGEYTVADYIAGKGYPLILVTNPKLGSVNHTLLSLELCRNRGIDVSMLVFNLYPETSPEITYDTRRFLKEYIANHFAGTEFFEVPFIG